MNGFLLEDFKDLVCGHSWWPFFAAFFIAIFVLVFCCLWFAFLFRDFFGLMIGFAMGGATALSIFFIALIYELIIGVFLKQRETSFSKRLFITLWIPVILGAVLVMAFYTLERTSEMLEKSGL